MEKNLNKNINIEILKDDTLNDISAGYKANSIEVWYSSRKKCYYTFTKDKDTNKEVVVRIPDDLARRLAITTKQMVKIVGDPYCSESINQDLVEKYKEAQGRDITDTIQNFS